MYSTARSSSPRHQLAFHFYCCAWPWHFHFCIIFFCSLSLFLPSCMYIPPSPSSFSLLFSPSLPPSGEGTMGPVVKQIMDHPRCAQLREGDIILEVHVITITSLSWHHTVIASLRNTSLLSFNGSTDDDVTLYAYRSMERRFARTCTLTWWQSWRDVRKATRQPSPSSGSLRKYVAYGVEGRNVYLECCGALNIVCASSLRGVMEYLLRGVLLWGHIELRAPPLTVNLVLTYPL